MCNYKIYRYDKEWDNKYMLKFMTKYYPEYMMNPEHKKQMKFRLKQECIKISQINIRNEDNNMFIKYPNLFRFYFSYIEDEFKNK